jgi:hypothetical protein
LLSLTSGELLSTRHPLRDALSAVTLTLHAARDTVVASRSAPERCREVARGLSPAPSPLREAVTALPSPRARENGGDHGARPDLDAKQSANWVSAGEAGGTIAKQYRQ